MKDGGGYYFLQKKIDLGETVHRMIQEGNSMIQICKKLNTTRYKANRALKFFMEHEKDHIVRDRKLLAKQQMTAVLHLKEELSKIEKEQWGLYKNGDNKAEMLSEILERAVAQTKVLTKLLEPFVSETQNIDNYVTVDKFTKVMKAAAQVIETFVPAGARKEAIKIMMKAGEDNE